jgi:putative restriction endonuclease
MAKRYFGELPGVTIGSYWLTRQEVSKAEVHRPTVGGISGTKAEGADSVVVSGGYEDDQDYGHEIIYTGAGGNDPASGKQIADQTLDQPGNAGMVTSQLEGLPVRVVRGAKGDPAFSPTNGFRYDGLYRVADHWSKTGKSGFQIWRFKLVRLTPQEEAPYVPAVNLPAGNLTPTTSTGIATRTIRSTAVSSAVKKLYDDACQVCDTRLEVPGGSMSEGAHVRALGKPHLGPDVPENVLCLCPNHHALFDNGGVYIKEEFKVHNFEGSYLGPLTRHSKHAIGLAYLRYHRELWGH